jgi:Ser/Thr protein kinase RdoA (MazF antagonist)
MKGDSHRRKLYDYCTSQWEYITKRLDFAEAELKKYMDKLPVCIIHEDINPSNLMFDENDKVAAIFDFDWVTEGYRIYDVAWMCHQVVSSWKEDSFGYMKLDQVKKFLSIYNNTIKSLNCNLGPLTDEERHFFPAMMILSCMKINFDFISYMYDDPNGDTFKWYLYVWKHFKIIKDFDDNYDAYLKAALDS